MKGTLTVTENALASLLGLAAHEVPGVVGMAPSNLKEGLQKILGRAQASDGVLVAGESHARTVDVHIVVAFGTNISTVAENVRERIVYTAKTLAGVQLEGVSVHVVGVAKPTAGKPGKAGLRRTRGE
jgi:uncharacterized alkaline shock family protein YloU